MISEPDIWHPQTCTLIYACMYEFTHSVHHITQTHTHKYAHVYTHNLLSKCKSLKCWAIKLNTLKCCVFASIFMGFKSIINLSSFNNVLSFSLSLLLIGGHIGSLIHVASSQRETLTIWKAKKKKTDQSIFSGFSLYEVDKVRQGKARLLLS